jgi:hypothetical protein
MKCRSRQTAATQDQAHLHLGHTRLRRRDICSISTVTWIAEYSSIWVWIPPGRRDNTRIMGRRAAHLVSLTAMCVSHQETRLRVRVLRGWFHEVALREKRPPMGGEVRAEKPELVMIELTIQQAYEVLAAVELSPLENEVVLQTLLSAIYSAPRVRRASRGHVAGNGVGLLDGDKGLEV